MLRFKLRRSVPFRLEEAAISSYALAGPGPEALFLVAVMMRSVVEHYEALDDGTMWCGHSDTEGSVRIGCDCGQPDGRNEPPANGDGELG